MPTEPYRELVLLLLVSIAAVNDLATRRIPNRLLLAGLAAALMLDLLSLLPENALMRTLGGVCAGFALFLPFYLVRGMAAGDVKLMAVVGALTGPADALQIAILTWCAGGIMAVLVILARGQLRLALDNIGRIVAGMMTPGAGALIPIQARSAGSMPYGLAIAAGTVAVLVRNYA